MSTQLKRLGCGRCAVSLCILLMLIAPAALAQVATTPQPAPSAAPNKEAPASADGDKQDAATSELLIFLTPGTNADAYARDHGLVVKQRLQSDPDAYVFTAGSAAAAVALANAPAADNRVRLMGLNEHTQYQKMSFVPNDPYFPLHGGGASQLGQWHLVNQYTVGGPDARVQGAWSLDYTGAGVIIGIVDDSLETAHPDLAANYVATQSYNFGSYTGAGAANNPNPYNSANDGTQDRHGVSVAGVAAARGGNGVGVTGAAPYASLAGLRIDFPTQTTAMFVDATLYHSSGSDTSIAIKNHSYGYSVPYIATPLDVAALAQSTAAGTIHVFAAGNDRESATTRDLQNSPNAIAVAALGGNGQYAYYSNFGSNVCVTAPSSSSTYGITTTDRTGGTGSYNYGYNDFPGDLNYTDVFGGTSSASPLVSGVLALVKQAQPNLDTRFAKHLLAMTSDVVDANDATREGGGDGVTPGSAWRTNAAGYHFNNNYGFGLIDATELVQQAVNYSGVTPLQTATTGTRTVGAAIPDNNMTGVTRTVAVSANQPLEEVLLTLDVTHTWRGDLEAILTAPSGTISQMLYTLSDGSDNINWTFTSNAFWGENPLGTWSVNVRDVYAADVGTWNSYSLDLRMGSLIPVPEPGTLGLLMTLGGIVLLRRRRAAA